MPYIFPRTRSLSLTFSCVPGVAVARIDGHQHEAIQGHATQLQAWAYLVRGVLRPLAVAGAWC